MKKIAATLLATIALAGCNFDPAVLPTAFCETDDDCRAGRACVAQTCVDDESVDPTDMGPVADTSGETPGCSVDRDEDGFFFGPDCAPGALDCNDNDAEIFPGAATRCNGEDNDCDGEIDTEGCECTDGLVSECGTTNGVCELGMRTCVDGTWGECTGGVQPIDEQCNGEDDDCDGTVDEGCPCAPGDTKDCGLSAGVCEPGEQSCVDGTWSDCVGGVGPSDETCNGEDDDCDGITDNNTVDGGAPCSTGEDGICSRGSQTCRNGQFSCERIDEPRAEVCNTLDDDCDGDRDEDVTRSCSSACGPGVETCENGGFGTCLPSNPPDELCNGGDDDCDGDVDETFPEAGASCDTGEPGVCAAGESTCKNADIVCTRIESPSAETCDGIDNDCDGLVDEDVNGLVLAEACGGQCPNGSVRLCLNGAWTPCDRGEVEICNGQDDNCDSAADNQAVCYRRCPGGGAAAGTLDCSTGACELPPEICGDGIDNDCDGTVDQSCNSDYDDMAYVPGGTFVMGSRSNSLYSASDERPIHVVELKPFFIDRFEATRDEYGDCVIAGSCSLLRSGCPLQLTQQQRPITCLTYEQAAAFCAWQGKRLPTEAEWEKAARGPFPREVLWPWGDAEDLSRASMDCGDSLNQCTDDVTGTASGASYYGAHHMAGNAAEWVTDFYDSNYYTATYTVQPENTSSNSDGHVIRGGSLSQALEFGRVANRAIDDFVADEEIGVRCAR